MADYNSIESVIASIDTMTISRDNLKQDDGADLLDGVDWFNFKGVPATKIYVSGNSWVGLGASLEQIKINRRDGASWTIRHEEGTILGSYKFYHLRWEGQVVYNSTSASTLLKWDMLLLDTGNIVLYFDTLPTSSIEASSVVANNTLTLTPVVGAYITLVADDKQGNSFTQQDGVVNLPDPYDRKFLVGDSTGKLYSTALGTLTEITGELTAQLFSDYGAYVPPEGSLLLNLVNPTLYYWHDSLNYFPDMQVNYSGIPYAQTLLSEVIDMSDESIHGIENVVVEADDNSLFGVSFDSGESFWALVDGAWTGLDEENSGMTKSALEAVGVDTWAQKATDTLQYRVILTDENSYLTSLTTNYLNVEA